MAIETAPRTHELKLHNGSILTLCELSLLDIADGEAILGIPSDEWFPPEGVEPVPDAPAGPTQLLKITTVLWLAARKFKLSEADVIAKKWIMSKEQLMARMNRSDLNPEAAKIVGKCFSGSQE